MAFAPTKPSKSPYITHLASSPSRNSPTNSAEETDKKTAGGWDARTGRRLWTLPVDASYGYIVPSPVVVDGRLLLTSDQENARLVGFTPSGTVVQKPMAANEDLSAEVSTPCVWGRLILGIHSGLVLLDPASSDSRGQLKTLWSYDQEDCLRGVCHAIVSEDRALVLCEDGQLLLLAADRQTCKILDRMKVCNRTWVHPALADGRLYVRDRTGISCYLMRDSEHPRLGRQQPEFSDPTQGRTRPCPSGNLPTARGTPHP